MVDTAPGQVGNVDKSVYTTQVDEYPIRGNILNDTFEYLAFFQLTDDLAFLLFDICFDKGFMGNHHVFEFLVDLYDLEFHVFSNVLIVIADRFYIDLGTRKEGLDSKYIYDHTSFGSAFYKTGYHFFLIVGCIYAIPCLNDASLPVRKYKLPAFILPDVNEYLNFVTDFKIGVVSEFIQGDDPF